MLKEGKLEARIRCLENLFMSTTATGVGGGTEGAR